MLHDPAAAAAMGPGALPPFANKENRLLDSEIKASEAKLAALNSAYDDHVSRANAMKEHMKNVQQEIAHTQRLCDARNREINTEEHFKQLADREKGRLIADIKRCEKEIADLSDQLNLVQNDIYRTAEKIDSQRTELNLEKEELEEWLRVQSEKDEDNFALLKYTREDEARVKSLTLQIERLVQEVARKRNALSAEVTETQVSQVELDKTTAAFRALHAERQNLLASWEGAIRAMKERDADIEARRRERDALRGDVAAKQGLAAEKQAFLDSQAANNLEIRRKIRACDRTVSKCRSDYQEQQAAILTFQDEVEVLRNTLNKTATDLVNRKIDIGNLKSESQEKQNKLLVEKANREEMKKKLDLANDMTKSMEFKAQQLVDILKAEENKSKSLDRELKILKEQQFKQSQEAFRMRRDEKNLTAEVAGAKAASKNLMSKIIKYDNEALKQQALLYNQDFQIQQLERKVRRAQGERSDEEKEMLTKKIEDLNSQLEEQTRKWHLLNTQLKKSQDDIRQSKRRMEALIKEKEHVAQSIDELNMYNTSAANQLAAKIQEKEELTVEENILRLELRKLRGFLSVRADEVYSLENRQIQLGLALEERTREMNIHKEMLRIHVKNAEEERAGAAAELRDRVSKVEKLKKRYEIVMTQFNAPDDDGGGGGGGDPREHTQAYYVIKAAQKREELQREGDALDAQIRTAEKEIKALENTLSLLNSRNEDYRKSLHQSEMDSKDAAHRDTLEQQFRSAMEKYKSKRREIHELQEELTHLEKNLIAILSNEQQHLQAVSQLEQRIAQLDKELSDQGAKRERALKQVSKLSKDLRKESGFPADVALPGEADIQIKEAREIVNTVVDRLLEISEKFPDMSTKISMLLSQAGIAPTSRAPTRANNRRQGQGGDATSVYSATSSAASNRRVGGGRGGGDGGGGSNSSGVLTPRTASQPGSRQGSRPASRAGLAKTNINVTLPPTPRAAAGFVGGKVSSPGVSPSPRQGASSRLKKPARPGSATSNSSHGSIPQIRPE